MPEFASKMRPLEPDVVAPDGSNVRILLGLDAGGMAHFELAPGEISTAVTHKTVEEIWYFLSGRGQMWREQQGRSETLEVYPGICISIPLGTRFQFRNSGTEALCAVAVTMPPWPGDGEAVVVPGPWEPTVPR